MPSPVQILGFKFLIPTPYHAGHVCTASEADMLNRMLVRGTSKGLFKQLSSASGADAQARGEEYIADYALGFAQGHDTQRSIRIEADRIARGILEARLYAKGQTSHDLEPHTLAEELSALASSEKVRAEAERRTKVTQEIAERAHDELQVATRGD